MNLIAIVNLILTQGVFSQILSAKVFVKTTRTRDLQLEMAVAKRGAAVSSPPERGLQLGGRVETDGRPWSDDGVLEIGRAHV